MNKFVHFIKRSQKRTIRVSLALTNLVLLVVVAAFVITSSGQNNDLKVSALISRVDNKAPAQALDKLSSADIAVQIAKVAYLPEAVSVANHADSANLQLSITSSDEKVIAKPQIIGSGIKSRKDIATYVAVSGDTISSVATKYGVTSDTIRWSNNLSGDSLTPGKQLVISPVSGLVYTVKDGDTVDSIANRYRINKDALVQFNDTEIRGLKVGEQIVVPNGSVAAPVVVASVYRGVSWGGGSAQYGFNGYDYGYCTWWVALRRSQTGRDLPSNLGNASSWGYNAVRYGYLVDHDPQVGDAVVMSEAGYGHVAYVEQINSDGSVVLSEMNQNWNWNVRSQETISQESARRFKYIH